MKTSLRLPILLALLACTEKGDTSIDDTGDTGDTAALTCGTPESRPRDTSVPEWSYHGDTDGPEQWGGLTGYELCGEGTAQTPIDIVDSDTVASTERLVFTNYDLDLPLDLLNNGHTLEVEYAGTQSAGDPQISYGDKTWYLVQFHGHSTSEHTLEGASFSMELHFVHKAADGSLAVVGVILVDGDENATIDTLLAQDPGPELSVSCETDISLSDNVPTGSAFYHYIGSLTTPPCSEDVDWFVLTDHGSVSAEQAEAWQTAFGGTTNRPVQATQGREVLKYAP